MAGSRIVLAVLVLQFAAPGPRQRSAMVAIETIPDGTILQNGMVELQRLPLEEPVPLYVAGCLASREIPVGEPVLAKDLFNCGRGSVQPPVPSTSAGARPGGVVDRFLGRMPAMITPASGGAWWNSAPMSDVTLDVDRATARLLAPGLKVDAFRSSGPALRNAVVVSVGARWDGSALVVLRADAVEAKSFANVEDAAQVVLASPTPTPPPTPVRRVTRTRGAHEVRPGTYPNPPQFARAQRRRSARGRDIASARAEIARARSA